MTPVATGPRTHAPPGPDRRTTTPAAPHGTAPAAPPVGGFTVLTPGVQTLVVDLDGRRGLWGVGVPPSGAFDDRSFALANTAVGNPRTAAGLESVLRGPSLRFVQRALVCLTGAVGHATLDGRPVRPGRVTVVAPGQVLDLGDTGGPGLRQYLAVGGGIAVPAVLGSRTTFLLGKFGGHGGRALAAGDALPVGSAENLTAPADVTDLLPELADTWELRVVPGPHGAPEHLTEDGVRDLFAAEWRVDHRADRTGVRLVGPAPAWAREDGGEAGLHPSNIHDSAYPVGGIMLSGNTPVIVGPDGPSLGGFVVPAAVIRADRWKLAQARPDDRVRLVPVTPAEAARADRARTAELAHPASAAAHRTAHGRHSSDHSPAAAPDRPAALLELPADGLRPALAVRRSGDHHLLVEAGPPRLDLTVRLQIHLLAQALAARTAPGNPLAAVTETVEGVRSLLLAFDPAHPPHDRLAPGIAEEIAGRIAECWTGLPDPRGIELPVREVVLPISLDDPAAHEAMQRYQRGVRPDAPWCPDNVEFIRRVNDLGTRDDVFAVVEAATYLVLGLGDVYLGAPVAVPLDPRHRLVTTKYDPARTWTPENAVGIGGVYLCVYGMEGPGGYQLVGRTVPVWRLTDAPPDGVQEPPWLLRLFDRLRFRPVPADELLRLRADVAAGRAGLEVREATLTWDDLTAANILIGAEQERQAAEFTARRESAFAAERARWAAG
ncbi:5-oxoprolinase/urea amidolyase family protein [Yinghuangia soli]|uniref:5-oxoprolinase/urea amidolyase family protein n=1 Tax=Yinghuangia soli TaxID=2908204 RepID=A0AA41Q025_9ACTN|nr:5-oxoprolinase/urea amidolyase family protein [Yinghuangia soli]MCF2528993.1 5-oxoprolinase/urea amidolyase family protein [Yinghuangia soli]